MVMHRELNNANEIIYMSFKPIKYKTVSGKKKWYKNYKLIYLIIELTNFLFAIKLNYTVKFDGIYIYILIIILRDDNVQIIQ